MAEYALQEQHPLHAEACSTACLYAIEHLSLRFARIDFQSAFANRDIKGEVSSNEAVLVPPL